MSDRNKFESTNCCEVEIGCVSPDIVDITITETLPREPRSITATLTPEVALDLATRLLTQVRVAYQAKQEMIRDGVL